jgi:hypothetical protein
MLAGAVVAACGTASETKAVVGGEVHVYDGPVKGAAGSVRSPALTEVPFEVVLSCP